MSRQRAAQRYRIIDAAPIAILTRLADLAARSLDLPMSTVAFIDGDDLVLVATHGFGGAPTRVPRSDSLVASLDTATDAQCIADCRADPRTDGSEFATLHRIGLYAEAPIITFDGHRIGTVAVIDTESRRLSDDGLLILEDLAAVIMEALELRLAALDSVSLERRLRGAAEVGRGKAERDRDEARRERDRAQADRGTAERDRDSIEEYAAALQRTLLPPSLPRIDGLDVASYFRPLSTRQVGGDFYDVFSLGADRWAFFIGDVLGHGVDAAVVTSLVRYTLRSAALHYPDPTDGLAELNAVLLREVEPRRFCTVIFGTIERADDGDGFVITMATGGHLPALVVGTSGTVDAVRPDAGMLVGALPNAVFDQCSVTVRRGESVLFYTDGLIEARLGDTPFDETALSAFVAERAGQDFDALTHDIATLASKLDQRDDIAVLALHVT